MKTHEYFKKWMSYGQFSHAAAYDASNGRLKNLKNEKVIQLNCSYYKAPIETCNVVQCGKVWVLLGKVLCNFSDGQAYRNIELAISTSKEELCIWKDLNHPELPDLEN